MNSVASETPRADGEAVNAGVSQVKQINDSRTSQIFDLLSVGIVWFAGHLLLWAYSARGFVDQAHRWLCHPAVIDATPSGMGNSGVP
jgi:hypothetical protein